MKKLQCEKCNGRNDVTQLTISGDQFTLCIECRVKTLNGKRINTKGFRPEN